MVVDYAYEASPQYDMDNTENIIQSVSYLWKKILVSVRYSPTNLAGNTGHLMEQMRTRKEVNWNGLHKEVLVF